ncbi:MAG: protein kinase [Acidimicrobiia bacterium]
MPPPLPDRYRLEIRIGRDGDTEQWLATDEALDRPVLIRVLGPETTTDRRREFLAAVHRAAGISHVHLAAIYEAGEVTDGAYAICEWGGGVTLADRISAAEPIPVHDFLANGAGLADALAALHAEGVLHGDIEPSAVLYSSAHPAKLATFGRPHDGGSAATDVHDLALTLESALVGPIRGSVPPSQVVNGLPAAVDVALADARDGKLDARGLAEALRSVPPTAPPRRKESSSWSWLIPAGLLGVLAASLIALGTSLDAGPASPVLFPARPPPATTTVTTPVSTTSTTLLPAEDARPVVTVAGVAAYDPFGDGTEQHSREFVVENLIDEDPATHWRTERYVDPLSLQKRGVGVTIRVQGTPGQMEALDLTRGVHYTLYWASSPPDTFDQWDRISTGISAGGNLAVQLPPRNNGVWLLWFTEVPAQPDGYYGGLAEVRFRP